MENYKNVSQDIRDQLNAEAEAVQIFLTWIDNDNVLHKSRVKDCLHHKLYDILKQHQNKVNELRNERLARNANPLTLVAKQQLAYHPQIHPTHYTNNSSTISQQAATKNREKEIVNSSPLTYNQEPTMVAQDDEISKEKEIDKLMDLISLLFKKIYKPTNNNLKTSSNTSTTNQDNTPRINRSTVYDNQRVVNVAGATENVGTQVVQQSGIQCYNYKEYEHVAKECQKPKHAKDAAYHMEKMLLYQELEAHYTYMAQIQEFTPDTAEYSEPIFDAEPLQKDDNDDLAKEYKRFKSKDFRNEKGACCTSRNISIMSQEKEAQKKFHKTCEDKELEKVIALENKIKILDEIVYKTGQSVQTMNMRNRNCKTSFVKPQFLKKTQRANPRLYDIGSRDTDLYSITLQETSTPNLICLMAKATSSQAWLWHRRLSHLNFNTINLLSKYDIVTGLLKLNSSKIIFVLLLVEIILFIIDSRCLKLMTRNRKLLSSRDTDLYSITLQETSTPNLICLMAKATSSQAWLWHRRLSHLNFNTINLLSKYDIVTGLLKLNSSKIIFVLLNRSLVIPQHEKTPYHIINGQKPSVKFFYIFGSLCYIVRDEENLDKMKEKENVPQAAETITKSNELDLLFSLMFDELVNGTTLVVSKYFAVTATDAPNQCQQQHTTPSTSTTVVADTPPLNIQTTPETTSQAPTQASTVTVNENIIQAETNKEYA
nr:integrase, catalytic region, zinc finger, CCHC-type, peptidase aspartic, catalytic [Tanacetum cinerariifolium]